MNWNLISQIATSISAIIAGGTIVSAYFLYRKNKRDEYVKNIRQILIRSKSSFYKLNQLISFEINNEIVSGIIYSRDMELPLQELYSEYFIQGTIVDKDVIQKYFDEEFDSISVPIYSPTLNQFEDLLSKLESDSVVLQNDFPGIYRVISSSFSIFRAILSGNKRLVRLDNFWKEIHISISSQNMNFKSIENYKQYLFQFAMTILQEKLQKDQPDIDDLIQLIDMSLDVYLDKSESNLYKISRKEKNTPLTPTTSNEKSTDDLREAEKVLCLQFDNNKQLKYRELVTKIEQRNL